MRVQITLLLVLTITTAGFMLMDSIRTMMRVQITLLLILTITTSGFVLMDSVLFSEQANVRSPPLALGDGSN
ncbi:hypothetical protein T484DRAFT_1828065 [Baffinella frigidus]|nr:hypothetical protein T484DRAFT_1828065 [Cryptophyta sp. CCMP2293]